MPTEPGSAAQGATRDGCQRLDRWLWAARFFRTRSMAQRAISRGRVQLNDQRVRSARLIAAGDRLVIHTAAARFEVEVVALNEHRRPAVEARQLYHETDASLEARQQEAARRRARDGGVIFDRDKPGRRARQVQRRLRQGAGQD